MWYISSAILAYISIRFYNFLTEWTFFKFLTVFITLNKLCQQVLHCIFMLNRYWHFGSIAVEATDTHCEGQVILPSLFVRFYSLPLNKF